MSNPTHPENRLAAETSLYLRQHARNPVDWFPWGPEALERARELDRPIFLSVGYSACHWCHVMERECFENETIARQMNEGFVCVKVDREERPDLDTIYMTAHHLLNRGEGGGWPLSVFLSPDLTPFYAGTYFPPDDRYRPHRPSFPALLTAICEAWDSRRDKLREIGANVTGYLADAGGDTTGPEPTADVLTNSVRLFQRSFDPVHGGFGTQPKFPHAVDLRLLLRVHARNGSKPALDMVTLSLTKMARGGIFDQVGGGFARYSVDAEWLTPHFEKMLYDNALLAQAYTEAAQVTGDAFYEQVARETLDYVEREMTSPPGGFYSAQDADSEGEEGKFFVWSLAEIERVVGPELAEIATRTFGVTEGGNFEGHNILHRNRSDADEATRHGLTLADYRAKLADVKAKLFAVRELRVKPGRDEKILTAWNGLMIGAFAQAGMAFAEPRYVEVGRKAADFVLAKLRDADGRLFRTCSVDTPGKLTAYLDDYAYLADGLLTLHEATQDRRYLRSARDLAGVMLGHFADERGGFFFTADDHEKLIARTKDLHDNATPAANAVAVTVLVRLHAIVPDPVAAAHVRKSFAAASALMAESPQAAAQLLLALDRHLADPEEFVVVGPAGSSAVEAALKLVRGKFRPHAAILFHDPAGPADDLLPQLAAMPNAGDVTLYHHCRAFACEAPAVGLDAVERACR
jgi:uncharacterized protein YyaL (SSP411 family)